MRRLPRLEFESSSMNPGIEANTLLRSLPRHERGLFLSAGNEVNHQSGDVLFRPGEPFDAIYFPRTCVISITTEFEDGRLVESASTGCEGVAGLPLLLGARHSRSRVLVQVPGDSLRIPAAASLDIAGSGSVFRKRLDLYIDLTMSVMSQSAGCLAMHQVAERCARWLLETRDRVGQDRFHLTQEFLAAMLGTHRPTVTIAAAALQDRGLIEYHRGEITILDRTGLEAIACECYSIVRSVHEEFLESGLTSPTR
jgi:CRP-like cAMP-binding protein